MHRARRRFGQNFLHDPAIIEQMLTAIAPRTAEHFLEIGPGSGALTRPLLARGAQVMAIEVDRDLAARLDQWDAARSGALQVIEADALSQPVAPLIEASGQALRVVGNLPYNLSTPLLFHLTAPATGIHDLHLLLQREVVDRMAAGPGSRIYGRLSVMIQARCQIEPLFEVPPGAFSPPPQVTSRFVRLIPHAEPPLGDTDTHCLSRVVAAAFAQRRKTLRNALRGLVDDAGIAAAGIDPGTRAERIDLAGYGRLARILQHSSEQA
ncbi:16S rRNA (adenine(1518)-N(6)/adenine(1519)-N(6))-dimethyltransferase RsmA [Spiribacter aquaticus]|uniref:Ribosomal RNA small subunit methyltransferase A n=1 Tax=Spiribacter aquaticus TaxID=1935996 RepID=A0A557RGU6_9GAMM|nr:MULTISPECIES: 16S rRNA (adenine(1518)-N(6)/adenine(1519)-N(6))-dimethyltransferase RsmA [Spiribacter]KAF0280852.1 16S rRNA (adenine(1518)-N(6)/adenine(1519)-N(6))-dimethyltransferase [Spiribacter roseus]TVO64390.1 16S rRNA (adenine(1518)-N(6)/adenine(1519)-N(6))-dimethyltransferase RsmA [Spiribacter aquaticus]